MKRITRPTHVTCAVFILLLCVACTTATAGEPVGDMPTAPTLFYACMSTGKFVEYDSAAFAGKNPGAVYKDHYNLNLKMTAAFDAYLTQKYGFHGLVQCGRYNTLAEAQHWLQGRKSQVQGLGQQYQYVATDWTYDAGATESAPSATTTTPNATVQTSQPAASAASPPTTFYVCVGVSQGVAYESAIFEAGNDALTARRMYGSFMVFLNEKHKVSAQAQCTPQPTRAAAQTYLQQFSAGVSGVSQHVATGWVYNAAPTASAQPATNSSPVASTASASKPAAPQPAAPTPAAPQPVTAAAAIKPAAPAAAAAPKGMFVVCYADTDPRTRYYNPPVDGGDGNYGTWMPSYQGFMQQNHRYARSVRCSKFPTLDEAQAYYQTTLDQARVHTSINGIPSPIVITNWTFK